MKTNMNLIKIIQECDEIKKKIDLSTPIKISKIRKEAHRMIEGSPLLRALDIFLSREAAK
jgi:hypothetical protein